MEVSERTEYESQHQTDASKKANPIYCDPCQHDGHQLDADGYCIDCKEYLCSDCYSAHRRPAVWRHHQLLDVHAMPKTKPAKKVRDTCKEVCKNHAEKIIEYFCNDHETFGCSVCMTTGHRACIKVDYIPEVATTFDTSTELNGLQDYLFELIMLNENNKFDILSNSKAVDLQAKGAKVQIKQLRTEVNELFDRLEKDIDNLVDDIKDRDETEMSKLANKRETISNDLQNYISDIETKLNERKMCQLFVATKGMNESIIKIAKEIERVAKNNCVQRYSFEPNPVILDMKRRLTGIGTLKFLDKNSKCTEFESDINVKAEEDNEHCEITGMALLSKNQLVVVDSRNQSVKLVDVEQKQLTAAYKSDEEAYPFDVTEVEHLQIAVSYPSAKAIVFLTISESKSFRFDRAINANGDCHGIECNGSNLVVSFNSPPVVKILTMNGRVIKTIKGNFEYPDYVALNHIDNTVFISNWNGELGSVTRVTKEGQVIAAIEDGHLGGTRGIIFDKTGTIFVCSYYNHNVLQMNENCEKIQELLNSVDGILNPNCIAKSNHNTLFIGMDGDDIKLFKLY